MFVECLAPRYVRYLLSHIVGDAANIINTFMLITDDMSTRKPIHNKASNTDIDRE